MSCLIHYSPLKPYTISRKIDGENFFFIFIYHTNTPCKRSVWIDFSYVRYNVFFFHTIVRFVCHVHTHIYTTLCVWNKSRVHPYCVCGFYKRKKKNSKMKNKTSNDKKKVFTPGLTRSVNSR